MLNYQRLFTLKIALLETVELRRYPGEGILAFTWISWILGTIDWFDFKGTSHKINMFSDFGTSAYLDGPNRIKAIPG